MVDTFEGDAIITGRRDGDGGDAGSSRQLQRLQAALAEAGRETTSTRRLGNVLDAILRSIAGFSPGQLELVAALADQAVIGIQNARLNADLEQQARELRAALERTEAAYDATLQALTGALDLRDRETPGHGERVAAYALELAGQLGGFSPAQRANLRRGALLHDVGKIGVPDAILRKPGPLTELEWRIMRRHPELGYQILVAVPFLQEAAVIPLYHHERWDGSGYPRGLAGEAIPLPARIFAVADALDAITSDRPYRPAASFERAATLIVQASGSHFDPDVVAAFARVPLARWEAIGRQIAVAFTG